MKYKFETELCTQLQLPETYFPFLKFIFRCQIAVHQECYGAINIQDFASWVCRACETPVVEKECCLCPVKGMFSSIVS